MHVKNKVIFVGLLVLFLSAGNSMAIHFIGLHKNEIKVRMENKMKEFNLDESSVNRTFNYLKYVDYLAQQTILFFLDENDICTASKWICDYVLLDEKIDELNSSYNKTGDHAWQYEHNDVIYEVTLEEEDWFFSIITRQKK